MSSRKKTFKNDNLFPKVNFIGNKEGIAEWISEHFPKDAVSIFDAFSGGASVSYFSKKRGMRVISNDILTTNYLMAKSLVENSKEILTEEDVEKIFTGKPMKGFMYKNYANRYYFPKECMELDLFRKNIIKLPTPYKRALALTLLRRAMIRKMPYSRFNLPWKKIKELRDEEYSYSHYGRKRSYHNETFQQHFLDNLSEYNIAVFDNGKRNKAFNLDIFSVLERVRADIIYLDPPYTGTMNNYHGFYGVLDSYIHSKIQKPFKNNFVSKEQSLELFDRLFSRLGNYKYWLLSYNNSSYPNKEDLIEIMERYSKNIKVFEKVHTYQVTGKTRKRKNKEYLFVIKNQ